MNKKPDYEALAKHYETFTPIEELHEDDNYVLLWKLPIEEPPIISSLMSCDFDREYYTHFTPIMDNYGIDRALEKLNE